MRRDRDDDRDDNTDDDDDELDDYTLIRGGGDQPDGVEESAEHTADDRRTKRIALGGLAAVLVIIALAITLTSVLVDTSSDPRPTSPHAAAQTWGDALVAGNRTRLRRLECDQGSPSGDVIRLIVTAARRIRAGSARETDSAQWSVPLEIDGPDGSNEASADVTVVLRSGAYLVC